jgi:hypothetical protein
MGYQPKYEPGTSFATFSNSCSNFGTNRCIRNIHNKYLLCFSQSTVKFLTPSLRGLRYYHAFAGQLSQQY